MTADAWDPDRYARFRDERRQPWDDLVALLAPLDRPRILDLGCGDGALTRELHQRLGALETLGVDSSPAMLEKAAPLAAGGLRFALGDAGAWQGGPYDLVFSNAALHWVPDHATFWPRLAALVAPGGQLAVQVPVNDHHPSHAEARAVAETPEFSAALAGHLRQSPVLEPEWYATTLHRLGFLAPRVRVEIYTHLLGSRDEVVEWVRGSVLTDYQHRLPDEAWRRFLDRYRARLAAALPDLRPFPYTYRRLFVVAGRP